MIYLTSLTVIVSMLFVATILGRRVADLLPSTVRTTVGFYIAPLLGLSLMVLISAVYGWISPFKTITSASICAGIVILGLVFEKQRAELLRDWLVVSLFAIVASIPILAPAFRFDSFNPFNDTFTYLVHGQWLQHHDFAETVKTSGFYPSETQVALYQGAGHRMGGSFFLAFVQSVFHLEWSYYAYLPTMGIVFALGSLAMGGLIQQVTPISKWGVLALCLLPAFSMNGFVFGAQYGFFPQTFGLAFAAGLVCLIPGLLEHAVKDKPTWTKQFIYLIPLALACSALLLSYNDMFPVLGAGVGLFLLLSGWMFRKDRSRIVGIVLIFSVQVLALVNVEAIRIIRNFVHTLLGAASGSVHFGWKVLWSPMQFVAHSFGMKSPFENQVFWIDRLVSSWIFPILLIGIIYILVTILRKKPRNLTVLLLICINVIFWMAFLKFRYAAAGLEGEIGNTFLQFKLAKWLAPINLTLLGICIAYLLSKAGKLKFALKLSVAAALGVGMFVQVTTVAQMFTLQLQDETMQKHSPFNVFLDLRSRLASIPKDQVIYLGIPQEHHKVTQMVAYVLSDRKLAGKYEDGYLRGTLPESDRDMSLDIADWMIQFKPSQTVDENPLDRVGPFLIHKAPFAFYNLSSVNNAYGMETGDKKTWNWVNKSIEYKYQHQGKPERTKIKFQFLLSGKPRTLTVLVDSASGENLASYKIPMLGQWGEFESPFIETHSQDLIIRLSADGESIQLSPPRDTRETRFLIQNMSIESK